MADGTPGPTTGGVSGATRELMRHAGCPEGAIGIAVAELMDEINHDVQAEAVKLVPEGVGKLLEIGFGGGGFRFQVGVHGTAEWYGLEKSKTLAADGFQRHIDTRYGVVEDIPWYGFAFDCVVALNTIYWWDDVNLGLSEIRRVLRPGGTLIVGMALPDLAHIHQTDVPGGPRYLTVNHLRNVLLSLGFERVIERVWSSTVGAAGVAVPREYALVCAT
jgi:SAM-dependent methyltransferase